MTRTTVSVVRQEGYEPEAVLASMRRLLDPLGGMGAFVKAGQRVLLKPNILGPFAPEKAVTTHPAVVRAAAILCLEQGAVVSYGDSPGVGDARLMVKRCGLKEPMELLGVPLADFSTPQIFEKPGNAIGRRMELAAALAETDVLITLPKLKTHVQMTFTCAMKNQFGLVPGTRKGKFHYRMPSREMLAELMIDINRIAKPALAVVDGIVAMEGHGPSGGEPRALHAMLAGADLAAVDQVACELIGLDPAQVPLHMAALRLGWGVTRREWIDVAGDADWRGLVQADFEHVRELKSILRVLPLPEPLLRWLRSQWQPRPRIDAARCIHCGACHQGCPVEPPAIDPEAPAAQQVNDGTCIRCYCCHEFCPVKAIELRTTWLGRCLREGRGSCRGDRTSPRENRGEPPATSRPSSRT